MRLLVPALCLAMLTGLGLAQPAPVAAATEAKVVIIVGPTEGSTNKYRDSADDAYAEASKYTSDVTKVYSPNATWSAVKAAVKGANIVVYLGHGNGWPSPYTYDPAYKTKNGFGLNSSAGNGDSNNKYYGEPYVSTLELAPNAVIILNHLCYASGNSEPGNADPSQSTARKRVENYGAGFLAGKAGAVIADGHSGAAAYIRGLFTSGGTVLDVWRDAPNYNGHESAFASSRTSGATAYTDTETESSGYYRSVVTRNGLTVAHVLGAPPEPYPGTPFIDIEGSSFAADIAWLYGAEITSGCADDRYCPQGSVTRDQMASFLARALDLPASAIDHFVDDDGSTHEGNIDRVATAQVTAGCGPERYCPTNAVTREQMASFLARALDLPPTSTDYFDDDDGSTHENDINRLAKAGLTTGCGEDAYCPGEAVTRGQMAAFLHRAFD